MNIRFTKKQKEKLKTVLIDYRIAFILGLIIFARIASLIIDSIIRKRESVFDEMLVTSYNFAIFFALIIIVPFMIISAHYRLKTHGRHLASDWFKYRMPVKDMIEYFGQEEKNEIDVSKLPEAKWTDIDGIPFCKAGRNGEKLFYRPSLEKGNIISFGLPGIGKTRAGILLSALRFGGSTVTLDYKNDLYDAAKSYRRIKVIAPSEIDNSCGFDPLNAMSSMDSSSRRLFIENMSLVFLPKNGEEKEPYFRDTGRDFFCGIVHQLFFENPSITFVDIIDAIVLHGAKYWIEKIKAAGCYDAQSYVNAKHDESEKNVGGAYAKIEQVLNHYNVENVRKVLNRTGDVITPGILDDGFDIYLKIPEVLVEIYAPLTQLITQSILAFLYCREDNSKGSHSRPVLFLLDEFPQLNMDEKMIMTAMSTLRSKDATLYLAMQSFSQLVKTYDNETARIMVDLCGYILIFGANDPENRKYFSQIIGDKHVPEMTYNNGSKSVRFEFQPIIRPEEFGRLGDDVIVINGSRYIRGRKIWPNEADFLTLISESFAYEEISEDDIVYLEEEPLFEL